MSGLGAARSVVITMLIGILYSGTAEPAGEEAAGPGLPEAASDSASKSESAPTDGLDEPRQEMRVSPMPPVGFKNSGKADLDALLKLPSGYQGEARAASVAGANETEWRRRFKETRAALGEAREALDATKRELDSAATGSGSAQWNVAPPGGLGGGGGGGGQSTSPLSFKLRQAVKANRLELEEAERSLRELEIEANLAGVPKDWRGIPLQAADQPPREVGQLLD